MVTVVKETFDRVPKDTERGENQQDEDQDGSTFADSDDTYMSFSTSAPCRTIQEKDIDIVRT